jgi:hypothetical protein
MNPASSWDLNLADARDRGALGDVERQQPERVLFAINVDRPPDRVAPGAARGQCHVVPKRALVSLERSEDDAALVRRVTVVKQVGRHAPSLPRPAFPHIGATP